MAPKPPKKRPAERARLSALQRPLSRLAASSRWSDAPWFRRGRSKNRVALIQFRLGRDHLVGLLKHPDHHGRLRAAAVHGSGTGEVLLGEAAQLERHAELASHHGGRREGPCARVHREVDVVAAVQDHLALGLVHEAVPRARLDRLPDQPEVDTPPFLASISASPSATRWMKASMLVNDRDPPTPRPVQRSPRPAARSKKRRRRARASRRPPLAAPTRTGDRAGGGALHPPVTGASSVSVPPSRRPEPPRRWIARTRRWVSSRSRNRRAARSRPRLPSGERPRLAGLGRGRAGDLTVSEARPVSAIARAAHRAPAFARSTAHVLSTS